jgi:tetratricopeptide (TPR) repeat protein
VAQLHLVRLKHMDNDTNQQILEELRKLRKTSQWTSVAAVLALLAICIWAFIRVPPRRSDPWSSISAALHQYDYPRALRLTQEFVAAHPDDYYAHGYLAYIYLQMDDLGHAEEEYSRSYELWPSEDTQKHQEAVRKRRQSEASKQK